MTIVAGTVFAVVGLVAVIWVWWIRCSGVRTQGVVVNSGKEWSAGGGGGMMVSAGFRVWRPVVQFTVPGGRTVEFRSKFSTPIRYEQGQPVPVCYRASCPESALIDTFSQAWLFPVGSLVIGVATLAVAVAAGTFQQLALGPADAARRTPAAVWCCPVLNNAILAGS
jgi:hypothetical protein